MGRRKRIGLIFNFDSNWTGGQYYLLNIIESFKRLPVEATPELTLFYGKGNAEVVRNVKYPFLKILPLKRRLNFFLRVVNQFLNRFFGKTYFSRYPSDIVDFIFPCVSFLAFRESSLSSVRKIFWIPDFQHKYLPHFFSPEEISKRDQNIQDIAKSQVSLVLSSEDAKRDFYKFYSDPHCSVKVIPFAVNLPDFEQVDFESLSGKFDIKLKYFMCPNQFWAHKNHMVVLKAINILRMRNLSFIVAFSGNETDYRNPGYTDSLKKFVKDNQLDSYVRFLGFIARDELLKLMKCAVAVIQPSMFEGWSTVVEDAKAMDQTLIASRLPVHEEQCGSKAIYFDPSSPVELASHMEKCLTERISFDTNNYKDKIRLYAEAVLSL